MNKKLLILLTSKFKKDYKLAKKRHLDMQLLDDVIRKLSRGEQLEPQNNDHILTGNWSGYHECHIQPNWLLIYKIDNNQLILTLTRTGTHSDLFYGVTTFQINNQENFVIQYSQKKHSYKFVSLEALSLIPLLIS